MYPVDVTNSFRSYIEAFKVRPEFCRPVCGIFLQYRVNTIENINFFLLLLKVASRCCWVDCKFTSRKWINPSIIAKSCVCLSPVLQLVRNTVDLHVDCRCKVRPYYEQFHTKSMHIKLPNLLLLKTPMNRVVQKLAEAQLLTDIRHLVPGARWIQPTLSYLS